MKTPERQFAEDLRGLLAKVKSYGDFGMPMGVFYADLLAAVERLADLKDQQAPNSENQT